MVIIHGIGGGLPGRERDLCDFILVFLLFLGLIEVALAANGHVRLAAADQLDVAVLGRPQRK